MRNLKIALLAASIILGVLISTLILLFYVKNVVILRIVWFFCGLIGFWLLKKNRPDFYQNKSNLFWIGCIIGYFCLGPMTLATGLVTQICPPLK